MRVLGRAGWVFGLALAVGTAWAGPVSTVPNERVALVPVVTVNADAGNGQVMTDAMTGSLKQHGCQMVPEAEMRQAVSDLGIPLERPIWLPELNKIGRRVKADFLIYTRVLVQGPTVVNDRIDTSRPAMIIHMLLVDVRSGQVLLGNEVFQEWRSADPSAAEQTSTTAAADEAAERLLSKIYPPTAVRGKLVDAETGAPLAEVEAFLKQKGTRIRVALTNSRGEFSFPELARVAYSLSTNAPRYHNVEQPVPFTLGQRKLVLALTPRPAAVSGVARDAAGAPLAGRQVQVVNGDGRVIDTLTTLADGSFGRPGLKAGQYSLRLVGNAAETTLDLKPGDLATTELRAR